ncbi:MAG: caspase family protein [Pseudomonadota bacterium]
MLTRVIFLVLTLVATCAASVSAWAEERFALVIGNANYQGASALANPIRDAEAVTELLHAADFDVTAALDLGQAEMRQAVSAFAAKVAQKGDDAVALVYFAGHGIQMDGANYLLPVDVKVSRASDVALQAVRLSDVMDTISRIPAKTRIVILDACRNNPFETVLASADRGLARLDGSTGNLQPQGFLNKAIVPVKTVPQGLAVVTAPPGSLVVYSTSPGATAADGRGTNSPFTAALVNAAKTPGAPIEAVLRDIRLSVHKSSEGKQTPWEVTALTQPFSFFPGAEGVEPLETPQKSDEDWRRELRSVTPERAYELVVVQNNVTVYNIYLSLYGDTEFAVIIRGLYERRLEMFAWFDALTLDTADAYEAFLALFPESDLARTAKRLAERDQQRSLSAQAIPSVLTLASTAPAEVIEKPVPGLVQVKEVIKTVIKKVPGPVRIKTVVKEVPGPVRVKIREVIKEVPGPVRVVVKEVIKRVPGPVQIKEIIKKVPGPIRYKEIIRKVPGPTKIKTVIKTVIKKVPGPIRYKTVIKKVPGPIRYRTKTVIRKVPGPVRVRTIVKRLRTACRCRRVK